jgi:formylglycine-generating enzyme required for sulfatase activity
MESATVIAEVKGGTVQGIVGAQQVVIENLHFYGSALPAAPPEGIDDGTIAPCPYPGLAYYGPQDGGMFFGRDKAVAALEAAVGRQQLTALVGASGTGKSSVVLAGLAPRLHACGGWRFSLFRVSTEPDRNPFMALARALVPLLGEQSAIDRLEAVQKLAGSLEGGGISLQNALGGCRASNPCKRILLIADQFEEAFTLVVNEERRRRFIDVLLSGFAQTPRAGPPEVALILTLRADFYGTVLRYRPLSDALQDHVENLAPMTREELREAIVKPAGAVSFESGLVETLLDAVQKHRGSLPLLQFALREMWDRQHRRCLTRAIYDAIGGVEGALAQRAQAIFDELTDKGSDAAKAKLFRRLFTRLVTLGEGVEDSRRVVDGEELGPDAWGLAQQLAGETNRLVVTGNAAGGTQTAEVVHEALIRNWPMLIDWIESDRRFQSWLRQLKPRVEEWRKNPADEGTLLRGNALAGAEVWLARRCEDLSGEERDYIQAGAALREANRRREDEEKAARERFRHFVRRSGQAATTAAVLFVVLTSFHIWVKNNNKDATWHMGWTALTTRAYLALHPPMEPEMAPIPAGPFTMGSPASEPDEADEKPPHPVTLPAFEMGKYEVTFEEYDQFAQATLRDKPSDRGWGRGRHPVINVSWNDAREYIKWLNRKTRKNYRLPSEAEWEYAARAGTTTRFWWGDETTRNDNPAHCNGCYSEWDGASTAPVGKFAPNAWGLYDTAGNVWEWTEDCWHDSYKNAPADGSAWTEADSGECKSRVTRGGSWTGSLQDRRSAERLENGANAAASDQGFRLARSLAGR